MILIIYNIITSTYHPSDYRTPSMQDFHRHVDALSAAKVEPERTLHGAPKPGGFHGESIWDPGGSHGDVYMLCVSMPRGISIPWRFRSFMFFLKVFLMIWTQFDHSSVFLGWILRCLEFFLHEVEHT